VTFTAAAVQIAPFKGDYSGNVDRVADAIRQTSNSGADLAVFPEAALSGYFLEGGVSDVAVTAQQLAGDLHERLSDLSSPIDAIIGFYEKSGGNIYNSAAHIEFEKDGPKVLHVHHKFFLPTYGVFDEERFVARGRDISAYDTRFGRFATLICEDVWHTVTPMIAALKGARVIAAIAASPARDFSGKTIGNLETYRKLVTAFAEEHGVWAINSMLVGFEGGKGFTGGSIIADPFGRVVAEGPIGEEHILIGKVDLELIDIARAKSPLIADLESVLEDIAREIDEVNNSQCP
jgi:predicted amidohydrolase